MRRVARVEHGAVTKRVMTVSVNAGSAPTGRAPKVNTLAQNENLAASERDTAAVTEAERFTEQVNAFPVSAGDAVALFKRLLGVHCQDPFGLSSDSVIARLSRGVNRRNQARALCREDG